LSERPSSSYQDEIAEQRRTIAELQTPVVQVWEGILALPIVGSLDTARAQEMTEALLERIVATGAKRLLLDITGVPIVDTQVAQGLIGVVQAARLLGTEVLLVGIRPEVAQAIVSLGLSLPGLRTYTDLQSVLSRRPMNDAACQPSGRML